MAERTHAMIGTPEASVLAALKAPLREYKPGNILWDFCDEHFSQVNRFVIEQNKAEWERMTPAERKEWRERIDHDA
jgi:hypothetical protein